MAFRVPSLLLAGLLLASLAVIPQSLAAQNASTPRISASPAPAPAPAAAPSAARPAAARVQPAPVGAIWVSTSGSYYRDTPRIDLFIEDLRAKPFSEAIIQVVDGQTAFYNSQILPKAAGIPDQFDPLATLLKGLHAAPGDIKLIAWVNPYLAGNVNRATPKAPNHVLTEHPDWLSQRADGTKSDDEGNEYLEPGLPEVQMHLEAMVKELVRKYPVDGIYFDPIGDPGADWGFNPAVVEAWRQSAHGQSDKPAPGDPAWIAFRAEVITQALAGLTRAAREARPGIIVGAGARTDGPPPAASEAFNSLKSDAAGKAQRFATLLKNSCNAFRQSPVFTHYHQNWPAWLSTDAAPINRLYLKDFKSESTEKGAFDAWLKFGLLMAPKRGGVQVMAGVAGALNESILAMAQLRKAVESGAGGIALSDYEKPLRDSDAKEPFMTAIHSTVLSPEFLASIANRNRLRAAVDAADAQPAEAETTSSLAQAAAQPGAALTADSGEELRLPPPPAGASARQTPADQLGAAPQDAAGGEEVTVRSQRTVTGSGDAATSASQAAARASAEALTRRQMLDELLSDPNFRQTGNLIEPGEKYKAYLKERFGNIFDE